MLRQRSSSSRASTSPPPEAEIHLEARSNDILSQPNVKASNSGKRWRSTRYEKVFECRSAASWSSPGNCMTLAIYPLDQYSSRMNRRNVTIYVLIFYSIYKIDNVLNQPKNNLNPQNSMRSVLRWNFGVTASSSPARLVGRTGSPSPRAAAPRRTPGGAPEHGAPSQQTWGAPSRTAIPKIRATTDQENTTKSKSDEECTSWGTTMSIFIFLSNSIGNFPRRIRVTRELLIYFPRPL